MTTIKYIDSKQNIHELLIDDEASEAEYLTIFENYSDMDRLSTLNGKREVAFAVCQIIPTLPRTLGYFDSEFKFKMPPVGLILELAKIVGPKIEKLASVTERLKTEQQPQEPEMSPEEKEAMELEARLAELKAKKNTAGVGFGV